MQYNTVCDPCRKARPQMRSLLQCADKIQRRPRPAKVEGLTAHRMRGIKISLIRESCRGHRRGLEEGKAQERPGFFTFLHALPSLVAGGLLLYLIPQKRVTLEFPECCQHISKIRRSEKFPRVSLHKSVLEAVFVEFLQRTPGWNVRVLNQLGILYDILQAKVKQERLRDLREFYLRPSPSGVCRTQRIGIEK